MKLRSLINKPLLVAIAISVFMPFAAQADLQESIPKSGDKRLRTYAYGPDQIYIFRGHYKYQSRIDLDPKETIQNISIGDSTRWMIQPVGHRIFLKPIEVDATTNMTIITDKRIYNFELYAEEAKDIRSDGLIFSASFVYGDESGGSEQGAFFHTAAPKKEVPDQKEILKDRSKYNFNYKLTGSKDVSPIEVFDDGEFTFMRFKDINADLPAVFQVVPGGDEALINYRKSGDYIVVEMVTSQFTLRFGPQVVCVFNETKPLEKLSPEELKKRKKEEKIFGIF
jgi:type IV secretion system protein VirB9